MIVRLAYDIQPDVREQSFRYCNYMGFTSLEKMTLDNELPVGNNPESVTGSVD